MRGKDQLERIHRISSIFDRANLTRRTFLTAGGALGVASLASAQFPQELGAPMGGYGERSSYEKSIRYVRDSAAPGTGASRTPLQDLYGIITPSALHFERHHAGVPQIDPRRHELLIHGLVEHELVFTMNDLRRFPSVSRIHFIECAGNSGGEHAGRPGADPQRSHGLLTCSEWTGVPLKLLLTEAGLRAKAHWLVAGGTDPARP